MNGNIIEGNYKFEGYFIKDEENLYPGKKDINTYIKDKYKIKIYKNNNKYCVVEEGGKIPKKDDFHISSDGTCCLGIFDNENISIFELFNNRLFSYFYSQSFYKKFKFYPNGEYSHGLEGIFEKILDEEDLYKCKTIINMYFSKDLRYLIGTKSYEHRDYDKRYQEILKLNSIKSIKGYYKTKEILKNPLFNF